MTEQITSYLLNLYKSIEMLNEFLAHYINLSIELKGKALTYYTEQGKTINSVSIKQAISIAEEEDKNKYLDIMANTRFWSIQIYTRLKPLKKHLNNLAPAWKSIESNYTKITTQEIPDFNDIQEFIMKINEVLVESQGSELLKQSQNYYDKMSIANKI